MRKERWSGRHHELALCALSLSKCECADFDKRRPELVEGLSRAVRRRSVAFNKWGSSTRLLVPAAVR